MTSAFFGQNIAISHLKIMVELFWTHRWKAIRLFLLTDINLRQLLLDYFAYVSTFLKLF